MDYKMELVALILCGKYSVQLVNMNINNIYENLDATGKLFLYFTLTQRQFIGI